VCMSNECNRIHWKKREQSQHRKLAAVHIQYNNQSSCKWRERSDITGLTSQPDYRTVTRIAECY
jgi:hypothetical protein